MNLAWTRHMGEDERCKVVYNGLDIAPYIASTDEFSVREEFNLSSESQLILNVGKFSTEKNHEKLVSVFHNLKAVESRAVLLVVGQGGNRLEEQIRTKVGDLGLADCVRFLGLRSDVPD